MQDTDTYAERPLPRGGKVYFRRATHSDRWEISRVEHQLWGAGTATQNHPVLHQNFATPDEGVQAVHKVLMNSPRY